MHFSIKTLLVIGTIVILEIYGKFVENRLGTMLTAPFLEDWYQRQRSGLSWTEEEGVVLRNAQKANEVMELIRPIRV
jgi:hypothetical protein